MSASSSWNTMGNQPQMTVWMWTTAAAFGLSLFVAYYMYKRRKPELKLVGEVAKLFIYPIKSCKGIPVESAECTTLGLKNGFIKDRVFLLITDEKVFVTARQEHKLLLAVPSFDGDDLLVNAPNMDTLRISLSKLKTEKLGSPVKTKIFGDAISGYDCGDEIASWFQRFLGKSGLRLLHYKEDLVPRFGKKSAYHDFFKKEDAAVFADLTPYLMLSEASVEDLNTRLDKPVSIFNFRPNIAIDGCDPYAEDKWKNIQIGKTVKFRNVKPCPRCMLTTINPNTAIRDTKNQEPLKTLKNYRKNTNPLYMKLDGETPCMGVGLCIDVAGVIKIGDAVYAA